MGTRLWGRGHGDEAATALHYTARLRHELLHNAKAGIWAFLKDESLNPGFNNRAFPSLSGTKSSDLPP